MKYPLSILDDIRARLPVSAVVGRRVRLIKAGREWKGLSPFNAEKTPSFFVNDAKQRYFDFSSGKNGDIFSFVMETEGLSFNEAVERLAGEAGVTLPKITQEAYQQEERRKGLHEMMEIAAAYYEAQLAGPAGAKARAYIDGRALGPQTQKRFRIGYSLAEKFALRDHLASKGVSVEAMIEAGLLVTGEDIQVPYDRFRDRVMFPICDAKGRVIAFGGRAMAADVPAKYLNSPETPLFHKGGLVYNLHNARKAAHDRGTVIAVEGYIDVIALDAAGFPHAVAPLGTALTEDQLGLMWRMADEPILCFDGDKAGRRAAFRAVDVALPILPPGKSLRFALLPDGQDPDDLVRSGGASAMERVLAAARPLVDMVWARELENVGSLDTPEQRTKLERSVAATAGAIKDETLRKHYRAELDARLAALLPQRGGGRMAGARRGQGGGRYGGSGGQRRGQPEAPLTASPALAMSALFAGGGVESPREALILAALASHPVLLMRHAEEIATLDISGRDGDRLRALLIDATADGVPLAPEIVATRIVRAGLTSVLERLKARVRPGHAWILAPDADPERVEDTLRQAITLHRRSRTLHSELRAAERALSESGSEADLAWLMDVQSQIASLEGAEADKDGLSSERAAFSG